MDTAYDWVENSSDADTIEAAVRWLKDQIKESPNDDIQNYLKSTILS